MKYWQYDRMVRPMLKRAAGGSFMDALVDNPELWGAIASGGLSAAAASLFSRRNKLRNALLWGLGGATFGGIAGNYARGQMPDYYAGKAADRLIGNAARETDTRKVLDNLRETDPKRYYELRNNIVESLKLSQEGAPMSEMRRNLNDIEPYGRGPGRKILDFGNRFAFQRDIYKQVSKLKDALKDHAITMQAVKRQAEIAARREAEKARRQEQQRTQPQPQPQQAPASGASGAVPSPGGTITLRNRRPDMGYNPGSSIGRGSERANGFGSGGNIPQTPPVPDKYPPGWSLNY